MLNFTDNQARAITSDSCNILCCAGAGSGKTRILTERIYRLLDTNAARPSDLLVLTFTRRAANEMQSRLIARLGGTEEAERTVSQITMGTFHSVALKMLRTWGHLLGYDAKSLTVVSTTDADTILRQIGTENGIYKNEKWVGGSSWLKVNKFREAHYTGAGFAGYSQSEQNLYGRMFAEYCNRLRSSQALDFGLILLEVKRLLDEHESVREVYNRTFKHVFVDESQDLDAHQHAMLFYFWPPATMFFVGDLRQSIYGFRNARPNLLRQLVTGTVDKPSDFEVIDLDSCFRCSSRIVDAANRLIAHNADPLAKPMISATGTEGYVEAFSGPFSTVADKVNELTNDMAFEAKEIAVLARSHNALKDVEQALNEAGLECRRIRGNRDIHTKSEFSKLHAALRLIVNRCDRIAFHIIAEDMRIDGEERARLIIAANAGTPIFDAYQHEHQSELGDLIACLSPDHSIASAIDQLMPYIRGNEFHLFAAATFLTRDPARSVADALDWYAALDFDKGEDVEAFDGVTLMTVHAAKGLEFDAVIIAGMNDGKFPAKRAVNDGEIKEERCAAYVALTRARLYAACHHLVDTERDAGEPSEFIREAGVGFGIQSASVGG